MAGRNPRTLYQNTKDGLQKCEPFLFFDAERRLRVLDFSFSAFPDFCSFRLVIPEPFPKLTHPQPQTLP